MGAASSDWVGGGVDYGASGVEPKGESGVLSLLVGIAAGVVAGLVVVVWLETGTTGGDAAGDCLASAGADGASAGTEGPASLPAAVGMWIGLVGDVGIATLRGVASATSIFRISSAKGKYQAGKGQDAFVIGVGCCQLLCENFSQIYAIAHHDGVDEEQPRPIHGLVMGSGHGVSLYKRIPQLRFWPKARAAGRMWISARCVPGSALFTKEAQNEVDGSCVGCNSSSSNGCIIFSSRVAGVELYDPVEIGSGWLPCQAKLAEVIQPVVYDLFKAVVDLAVIKEESLLFPSILGSNHSLSGRERSVGHVC
ncbi:hypothetical protein V6N13_072266 [Hibiscus sabdariffa]